MLPSSRPSQREKLTILGSHIYIPKNLKTLQFFFKRFINSVFIAPKQPELILTASFKLILDR